MGITELDPHQILRDIEAHAGHIDRLVNLLDQDAKLRGNTKKIHTGINRIREGNCKVSDTARFLYDPTPGGDDSPALESLGIDPDEPLPFDATAAEDLREVD